MQRSATGSFTLALAVAVVVLVVTPGIAPRSGISGWVEAGEPEAVSRSGRGAVRILVQTIVVDRLGTNSVAEDEADLFPGQSGVLTQSITLKAREGEEYQEEQVDLTTRVSLGDGGQSRCPIMLSIVATGAPRGGPVPESSDAERNALSLTLEAGEARMTPAYVSRWTGGRITLRITCREALPAAVSDTPSTIEFDVALERGEDEALPRLLRSDRLSTTLGGEAGSLFSNNIPLPDNVEGERRYRRERLDVQVAPRLMSGGRLQVDVSIRGEVATISASGTDERHPIDVEEILVLSNGESGDIEVTIVASSDAEGWSRLRYLLRVTGRF